MACDMFGADRPVDGNARVTKADVGGRRDVAPGNITSFGSRMGCTKATHLSKPRQRSEGKHK